MSYLNEFKSHLVISKFKKIEFQDTGYDKRYKWITRYFFKTTAKKIIKSKKNDLAIFKIFVDYLKRSSYYLSSLGKSSMSLPWLFNSELNFTLLIDGKEEPQNNLKRTTIENFWAMTLMNEEELINLTK